MHTIYESSGTVKMEGLFFKYTGNSIVSKWTLLYSYISEQKKALCDLSPRVNYTDRTTAVSVKLVATLVEKGCNVVSLMGPYDRISRLEPLLFSSK
jgi:hypothetical protein